MTCRGAGMALAYGALGVGVILTGAQFGTLMAASNCDSTYYYGPLQGYFDRQ